MRIALMLCLMLVMSLPLQAQEPQTKFAAAGIAFFQAATPQLQGWGALAIPINDRFVSYTDYDVSALRGDPLPGRKFTLPKIQYSMRTGVGLRIHDIAKGVTLWGLGGAGIAADGQNVVGSFGGGGFLDIAIGRDWGCLLILEASRNAVTGTEFIPRIGLRKKL